MILMLFAVPFDHFLFLRYMVLAERHFSWDILVLFPDSHDVYSRDKSTRKIKDFQKTSTNKEIYFTFQSNK